MFGIGTIKLFNLYMWLLRRIFCLHFKIDAILVYIFMNHISRYASYNEYVATILMNVVKGIFVIFKKKYGHCSFQFNDNTRGYSIKIHCFWYIFFLSTQVLRPKIKTKIRQSRSNLFFTLVPEDTCTKCSIYVYFS